VLEYGGKNEGLLQSLLSNATVIEDMTENHTRIIRSLKILIDSVKRLQEGPWKLSEKDSNLSNGKVENLERHREVLSELSQKSQGIIQLVRL
jgi:hypothetical protein